MIRPDSVLVVDGGGQEKDSSTRPVIEVAVGILVGPKGAYLLTSRPAGKVYAGYWEFPGGKLEDGESVEVALRRELNEEIGVTIGPVELWRDSYVDYPHALVHLNFCKIYQWTGALHMKEGQQYRWEQIPVQCAPVLPGTVPVLQWLAEEAIQ